MRTSLRTVDYVPHITRLVTYHTRKCFTIATTSIITFSFWQGRLATWSSPSPLLFASDDPPVCITSSSGLRCLTTIHVFILRPLYSTAAWLHSNIQCGTASSRSYRVWELSPRWISCAATQQYNISFEFCNNYSPYSWLSKYRTFLSRRSVCDELQCSLELRCCLVQFSPSNWKLNPRLFTAAWYIRQRPFCRIAISSHIAVLE